MNIVNYSIEKELIGSTKLSRSTLYRPSSSKFDQTQTQIHETNHFTSKLPRILKEHEFDLTKTNVNKIFCAQWLDERRVIMGTKCNKLILLDTLTGKYSIQNPVKSHHKSQNIPNHCGIHSISINPSRTLLATGAENVNDIAVYSLPNLEPVSVGYNAHKYWIFDIVWLDDNHVVSGAGDDRLALWSIDDNVNLNSKYSNLNSSKITSNPSVSSYTSNNKLNHFNFSNHIYKNNRTDRSILKRPSTLSLSNTCRFGTIDPSTFSLPLSSSSSSSSSNHNNDYVPPLSSSSLYRIGNEYFRDQPYNHSFQSSIYHREPRSFAIRNRLINSRHVSFDSSQLNSSSNHNTSSTSNSSRFLNNTIPSQSNVYDGGDNNLDEEENDSYNDDNENLNASYDEVGSDLVELDYLNSYENRLDEVDELEIDSEMDSSNQNNTDSNNTRNLNNNDSDEEQEDDNHDHLSLKRRRLDSFGKFEHSNGLKYITPTKSISCQHSKRIRALAYNPKRNEIAAISMNATFHYFDTRRFTQKSYRKLTPLKENVCLTINDDCSIYAVGSASHVQLLDANNARPLKPPIFIKKDIGVRSVHFRNDILSIGTGIGTVLFYDVRANKFLFDDSSEENLLKLQTTGGWILRNETFYENLPFGLNQDNSHAIYSHSYDPSGTKLFTAGGPLTVNLYGHYAGVWR